MYLKSLKIKIEKLGSNHTSVAGTYNNLTLLYKAQGKLKYTEELNQQKIKFYNWKLKILNWLTYQLYFFKFKKIKYINNYSL